MQKNILEVTDLIKKELEQLIKRTLYFQKNKKKTFSILKGKKIGLLFDSASLRTKFSFEIASHNLGGFPYFVPLKTITNENDGTEREIYEDIIDTLDRFVDCYVVRDYSRKVLSVLVRKDNPPLINGFSEVGHPSQALADISVIALKKRDLTKLNICAVCPSTGSGVIESFAYAILLLGGNITLITPTGKFKGKNKDFHQQTKKLKGKLTITKSPEEIVSKADVLYVDEWWENIPNFTRKKPPKKYQVTKEFLKKSKKDLIILHCLPAHHDREIAKDVFYSKKSIVFEEAEFRIYSAMALLEFLLKKEK